MLKITLSADEQAALEQTFSDSFPGWCRNAKTPLP